MSEPRFCVSDFRSYKSRFPEFAQNIRCVEEYLTLYDMFTIEQENERLQDALYNKTLKMLKEAIQTRRRQQEIATNQANELIKSIVSKYPKALKVSGNEVAVINEIEFNKIPTKEVVKLADARVIKKVLPEIIAEDVDFLEQKYEQCMSLGFPKFLCIETFANASHVKGSYIPQGCGLPYPEFRGVLPPEEDLPENVVGELMSKEAKDTLDCIFTRR